MDIIRVFVYGTLKPGEVYYQRYCAGKTIAEHPAIVQGRLYALPMGYPAMIPGDGIVHGYVLSFAGSDILHDLDQLEGYDPQAPTESNDYDRRQIAAFTPDRRSLGNVWVYMMQLDAVVQLQGILLHSGLWKNTL